MIDKFLDGLHPILLLLLVFSYGLVVIGLCWVCMKFESKCHERKWDEDSRKRFGMGWKEYLEQNTRKRINATKK